MYRFIALVPALSALVAHAANGVRPSTPRPSNATVATDSVDFVKLRQSSAQQDCTGSERRLCRIRRSEHAAALRAALDRNEHVLMGPGELTFVNRGTGNSMEVTGGLQYPMSRIVGTDLWVVTLRVADVERAVVSYTFLSPDTPLRPGDRLQMSTWRGPNAPKAGPRSGAIAGIVRVDTLPSRFLARPRAAYSYVPPARGKQPIMGVVYMGDGSAVQSMARVVDTLIMAGKLPRVMLVGVPSGEALPSDPPGTDVRAMEYLLDFETSNTRYLAHEKFIFEEVIPWAERSLGAPTDRSRRAVWGISNSAAWAVSMGLRHPDVLGIVLAFSPGGSHGETPPNAKFSPRVRFLLQSGTLEPSFNSIAAAWNDSLRVRGVVPTFREVIAGHDWEVWCEQFPAALQWAWSRTE